jgi:hypothetical protein
LEVIIARKQFPGEKRKFVGNVIIENNINFYFGKKGFLETLACCVMNEKEKKIEESSIQLLTVWCLEPQQ